MSSNLSVSDIKLERWSGGTVQRLTNGKTAWTRLTCKRSLMRTFFYLDSNICLLWREKRRFFGSHRDVTVNPKNLFASTAEICSWAIRCTEPQKKLIYFRLTCKGDQLVNEMRQNPRGGFDLTSRAAEGELMWCIEKMDLDNRENHLLTNSLHMPFCWHRPAGINDCFHK